MTYGSLFAGIGGMDLGLDRAGFICKWQVEIDPYARKILKKHWPDVPKHDDIKTFCGADWPWVDLVAGGFPCQDISNAGKRIGIHGERSGLFFELLRVASEIRPRFLLLENVAALLTRGMGDVLGTLAAVGYDAEWHCIPAAAVGAPHIRDRVFVLGWNTDSKHDGQVGSGSQQDTNTGRDSYWQDQSKSISDANGEGLQKRQRQDTIGTRTVCWAKPCRSEWWATEPDVGRVANGIPARVDRLRGLGNAVVPQVAEFIATIITKEMVSHDTLDGR